MPGGESRGHQAGAGTQGGSGSGGCRGQGWQELVQGGSCLHRSSELYCVDFFQAALRMRVLRRQKTHQMCILGGHFGGDAQLGEMSNREGKESLQWPRP